MKTPIIKSIAILEPTKVNDLTPLQSAAEAEQHFAYAPTDTVWKNGEIVGYFSVGTLTPVWCWFGKKLSPRESLTLINTVQQSVYRTGSRGLFYPVPTGSPFHPLMEHMGFKNFGNYDFFVKEF